MEQRNDRREGAPQCSKLRSGSTTSACPNTRSALPRTRSMCRCSAISQIKTLRNIGVALGHRRKMLAAIGEVAAATATEPKVFEPEPKPQETAERRQVTVLFSDLV